MGFSGGTSSSWVHIHIHFQHTKTCCCIGCINLLTICVCVCRYQSTLALIRAKAEDSGSYTVRAEIGNQSASHSFILQVKGKIQECLMPCHVPWVCHDLL